MVERLHRDLKAALKAVSPTPWVEALPIVLLSLRATVRQDIECAPAELVYGTTLRLPGDLFSSSSTAATPDFASYVDRLRATMQDLRPTPPRPPSDRHAYRHPDLETSSHVFVRHDGFRSCLQHPYDGPYRVIRRSSKHFTVDVADRHQVVSADRVKPAFIEDVSTVSAAQPLHHSRLGPRVHWASPLRTLHFYNRSTAACGV
ncbi:uncharacterized protein LOC135400406 [Ornithodoros turicata]|uniref:uncharacterized protein LOC135400406 n=1 Tax=Ornithodoros turicata TaxID=34597 RepID=UPI003138F476